MVQDPNSPPDSISISIKSLQTQCLQGFFIWGYATPRNVRDILHRSYCQPSNNAFILKI